MKVKSIAVPTIAISLLLTGGTVTNIGENNINSCVVHDSKYIQTGLVELLNEQIQEVEIEITDTNYVAESKHVPKNNKFKSYMPYTSITNKSSLQWKVNRMSGMYTDSCGMRRFMFDDNRSDAYVVAVGSYYGSVGDVLKVQLENGTCFYAVIGDMKADKHTDSLNMQHKTDGSVIEFLIDKKQFSGMAKKMGDISYLTYGSGDDYCFNSEIVTIFKLDNIM